MITFENMFSESGIFQTWWPPNHPLWAEVSSPPLDQLLIPVLHTPTKRILTFPKHDLLIHNLIQLKASPSGNAIYSPPGCQWFHPGVISTLIPSLPPREYLTTSGDILGVRTGGCYRHLEGRDQGCCKYPTIHKTAPHNKELSGPKMSIVLKLRNAALSWA